MDCEKKNLINNLHVKFITMKYQGKTIKQFTDFYDLFNKNLF